MFTKTPITDTLIQIIVTHNRFLYAKEIIENLAKATSITKGSTNLLVTQALQRLKRADKLHCFKPRNSNLYVWGLHEWVDSQKAPIDMYKPIDPAIPEKISHRRFSK